MKCELCSWAESPESIPSMSRHISTFHQEIVPDQIVVWRDGQMCVVKDNNGDEQVIAVYPKKIEEVQTPDEYQVADLEDLES